MDMDMGRRTARPRGRAVGPSPWLRLFADEDRDLAVAPKLPVSILPGEMPASINASRTLLTRWSLGPSIPRRQDGLSLAYSATSLAFMPSDRLIRSLFSLN